MKSSSSECEARFTCEVARTVSPVTATKKGRSQPDARWLSSDEQEAWRAVTMMFLQLPGPLDAQLQRDSGITLFEYLVLSGLARKFVGGSDPGGGVAEVEAAGGVQGVFGCAGEDAGG